MDTCIKSNLFVRSCSEKVTSRKSSQNCEVEVRPLASCGQVARLSSMVNTCESLVNVVKLIRAKDADRLEPKGKQPVGFVSAIATRIFALPADRRNLTYSCYLCETW
jgi:hypothetical protein